MRAMGRNENARVPFQMDGLKQLLEFPAKFGHDVVVGSARRHLLQPPPGFLCSASGAVSSGSPDFSLASILTRSSGSGLRSRAWDHWKRASSTRPDPPIGIAEMVVDGRILGLELDGERSEKAEMKIICVFFAALTALLGSHDAV